MTSVHSLETEPQSAKLAVMAAERGSVNMRLTCCFSTTES